MTNDRTTRRVTSPNKGNLDSACETVSERNVAARPSDRKRRQWCGKILGVIGLVAAAAVFAPSCAVSGSERPKQAAAGVVKELSPETVRALRQDTGVDPVYVVVVSEETPIVIGKPTGVKIRQFETEQELWRSQGKVEIRSIQPVTLVQFQRNPNVYCIYYVMFGSLRQDCFEL